MAKIWGGVCVGQRRKLVQRGSMEDIPKKITNFAYFLSHKKPLTFQRFRKFK